MKTIQLRKLLLLAGMLLVVSALGLGLRQAFAASDLAPAQPASPLHPVFAILDQNSLNVVSSGQPVSTLRTCGQCHDTEFITTHSNHADLGFSEVQTGSTPAGEAWDSSTGPFGHWDPLTYRYLTQAGDERLDLGTPEWIMTTGLRHVGGGPATSAINGWMLTSLPALLSNPETSILDSETGRTSLWNWDQSGVIEMNCFLCHTADPDTTARAATITAGDFAWANTATLAGTSLVTSNGEGRYTWDPAAFDENGLLLAGSLTIQDPTNQNCAACHGMVDTGQAPLQLTNCSLDNLITATTGQVISPARISDSGLNLAGKDLLTHAWDIHAERQLDCVDCHYSLNNPIYFQENPATQPDHLLFDPRRMDFGAYMQRPSHNLARGQSAQYNLDPSTEGTMRRCESCHAAEDLHASWLPYTDTHLASLTCESCHIPQMSAPAIESYDWTVITTAGQPSVACRGVEGDPAALNSLITGFQPVLLPRTTGEAQSLAPYNLVTTWFWVYDDPSGNTRPVRLYDLIAAYLEAGAYAPEVVAALDADGDGLISAAELTLDTPEKVNVITARLASLGLADPRIQGRVQPYSINHGVVDGEYATRDCATCHNGDSQIARPVQLAASVPGGVLPEFASDTNVATNGSLYVDDTGALFYRLDTSTEGLYVFGHSRIAWVDWVGGLFVVAVLVGISVHGLLRFLQGRKVKKQHPASSHKVYMYEAYERFWHWLQTILILVLLLTGLFIHRPDLFSVSFRGLVLIHNVSAAILALNAALSLFYHLVSGKVRQFIPRPRGFFDDAIVQARFYINGIFKKEPHPFEKTPEKKMNPLQQVTYLGILNVLLPLQGLTGILMWGVQRWPDLAVRLGGLNFLAPFHTLIAWVFAAFIIGHVYLTTTGGPRPLDSIKGMVTGWEEVEVHASQPPARPASKKKKK